MNKAATIYVAYWGDILVAMCAVLNMPNGGYKKAFRVHRLVVLPDYQSLNIGTHLLDWLAQYYIDKGNKFFIKSTHLRLANHCRNGRSGWVETASSGKSVTKINESEATKYKNIILNRPAFSFEYKSKDYTKPHIDIHIDYNTDMDVDLIKDDLAYLKSNGYYLTVVTGDVKTDNPIDLICQELGIRTQLLYYRGKISGTYKNKKILTSWTQEFSNKVRRRY